MSCQREMTKLVRAHREAGWSVEKTRGGHWKFTPPGGGRFIIAPGSPGTMRAIYNVEADLRRAGERKP